MVELRKFLEDYGNAKISGEERARYGLALSRLLDSKGEENTFKLLGGFMKDPELSFYLAGLLYHLNDDRFLKFLRDYRTNCSDEVSLSEINLSINSMGRGGFV